MKKIAGLLSLLLWALPAFAQNSQPGWAQQLVDSAVKGCWACGIFNTITTIGLSFADQVFGTLASGMTLLIGLFMALWLLYFAARLFLPFGPPSGGNWNEGAMKLFKLAFVLAFLQTSSPFWDYVFIPLISAGMGVAGQMASASDGFESTWGSSDTPSTGSQGSAVDYCSGNVPLPPVSGLSPSATQAAQAMTQMDCPMSKIQSQFSKGMVLGVAIMEEAEAKCDAWIPLVGIFSEVHLLVAGLLLWALFGFGYLMFPMLLIDVIMRVALVAATSPISIAAILFKSTSKVSSKAVWTLVQASLTLVFGAAISGIGKATMAYVISTLPTTDGTPMNNWDKLVQAIEDPCKAGLHLDFTTASYYLLLGTAIIMIAMLRKASSLAAELTGVSGQTGAQAGVAWAAGTVGEYAGKAAQATYKKATGSKSRDVSGNKKNNSDQDGETPDSRAAEVAGNPQK